MVRTGCHISKLTDNAVWVLSWLQWQKLQIYILFTVGCYKLLLVFRLVYICTQTFLWLYFHVETLSQRIQRIRLPIISNYVFSSSRSYSWALWFTFFSGSWVSKIGRRLWQSAQSMCIPEMWSLDSYTLRWKPLPPSNGSPNCGTGTVAPSRSGDTCTPSHSSL